MSGNSWVTLATNDSYSLGALVLARSLKRVGTVHNLTVMVTPGVTSAMRDQLASVFNVVEEVNILDSKDEKNLTLLTRPELGVTFTKLHCWKLTQFSKCVFLDADVLVLQNCDELFDREELSAAPDVGWPDCFNSGVFVYRPSIETYNALINFALSHGSFDGGDQGLLNLFFSDWATKDISRHLPFIYNMCSTATYSYLPAFKQFGQNVKIVHFIGSSKPWLQYLDSETRQVRPTLGSEHLQGLLQLWWDIFCGEVHSSLSSDMAGLAGALSQLTLGVARTPEQIALEEHLRKQAWEHGNVDYMGRDSFDNIWRKICQTLAEAPSGTDQPAEAPSADPLPPQSKPSSQDSSVVVERFTEGVTPADDTSPTLSELHFVASVHNENSGALLTSANAESISKKPDNSAECAPTDSISNPDLSNISPTSVEVQVDLVSISTPVTSISDLVTTSSALTPTEILDNSVDELVMQLKENVPSSLIAVSSESSSKVVQPVKLQDILVQKSETRLPATELSKLSADCEDKTGIHNVQEPVTILSQETPVGEISSLEIIKSSSETVEPSVSDDSFRNTAVITSGIVVGEFKELKEPELKAVSISSEITSSDPLDTQLTMPPGISESQTLPKAQSEVLENVETFSKDSLKTTDNTITDSLSTTDLVQHSDSSTGESTALDTGSETQKVTVTGPTPPTSPSVISSVPPVPVIADTLSVEPSILPTPPIGSELPATETGLSSGAVAKSTASAVPTVSEVTVSLESSSQAVEPKAPIPPKRRHKPSQTSDQTGNKSGKAASKSPKGKK